MHIRQVWNWITGLMEPWGRFNRGLLIALTWNYRTPTRSPTKTRRYHRSHSPRIHQGEGEEVVSPSPSPVDTMGWGLEKFRRYYGTIEGVFPADRVKEIGGKAKKSK